MSVPFGKDCRAPDGSWVREDPHECYSCFLFLGSQTDRDHRD